MTNKEKRVEIGLSVNGEGLVARAKICKILGISEIYFSQLCQKHEIKIEKVPVGDIRNKGLIRNMISENGANKIVEELLGEEV